MRRIIFIITLFIIACISSYSQEQNIVSGFLFDEYKNAVVSFKNLLQTNERINYNLVENQIYFVDKTDGEIKVVSGQNNILSIRVDNRLFLMTSDGLKELFSKQEPEITVQYFVKSSPKPQAGAFGGDNTVASITTYSDLRGQGHALLKNQDRIVTERYNVYWVDINGKPKRFQSFKGLLKLYPPPIRAAINTYIVEKKLSITDVEDVINLCIYASGLLK